MIDMLYLLVSIANAEPVTFGEYKTMSECKADLAPLLDAGAKFKCMKVPASATYPEYPGWVNGPSAGVWYYLTDDFNDKARRGLWRHSQLDLWRVIIGGPE
jgi:hypothetical protein